MTELIKQIRKILGKHDSSHFQIHFASDEIWMYIYEIEVPIIIDLKKKDVYVDCEGIEHRLTSSMLEELGWIVRLLEENLNVIEDLLKD